MNKGANMSGKNTKKQRKAETATAAKDEGTLAGLVRTHQVLSGRRQALVDVRDGVQRNLDETSAQLMILTNQIKAAEKAESTPEPEPEPTPEPTPESVIKKVARLPRAAKTA